MIALMVRPNGQAFVQGKIEDLVAALGMLEVAKNLVLEHHKEKQQLVKPVAAFPGITRNPSNGA